MGRSPSSVDKDGIKKGPWTAEEDTKLTAYIQLHGTGNWKLLPKNAGLERCGKSCRLRWTNYLRPDIKRGKFSFEEEETIIQLHSVLGNKWASIAARLPGRTDNEIKNYWNTHIRKRFLRNGIDPVTHAPRLDLIMNISPLLNSSLSNLICINQVLQNPQLLTLALNLGSLYNTNINSSDSLMQKLQSGYQVPPVVQPNQFGNSSNIINQQLPIDQNSTRESIEGYFAHCDTSLTSPMSQQGPHIAPDSSTTTSHEFYSYYGTSADQTTSSLPTFEIPDGLDIENFM